MAGWLKRTFGRRSAGRELKESGKVAQDPVCSMQVDEKKAVATSEYQGKTSYFSAAGCKKAFDENPEEYLNEAPGTKHLEHQGSSRRR